VQFVRQAFRGLDVFSKLPAEFRAELASSVHETTQALADIVRRSGGSQKMYSWMTSTNITRTIYTMAGWIEDPEVRRKAGIGYAMHCWSLLLMDGVIDADLGLQPTELASAAHEALRAALLRLEQLGAVDSLYNILAERHAIVWNRVKDEPTSTLHSIEEWIELAHIKAGWLLEGYARMSLNICGRHEAADRVGAFVAPLGVIFTALDDARDSYKGSESHANLKTLIADGVIDRDAAVKAIGAAALAYDEGVAIDPPVNGFVPYQQMFNVGTIFIFSDPNMAVPEDFSALAKQQNQPGGHA
jgi:hypothetical protein